MGKLDAPPPRSEAKPKPGEKVNPALMPASKTEDDNKAAAKARILTTMVLQERTKPRDTHILMGGDFTRPGAVATAGTPAVLPPMAQPGKSTALTRLDLAHWLVGPDNPLTSRVLVNRLWAHYFGLGLVETENDFGTQGTQPSNPQLLDWLATTMVGEGWSLKRMHRLIVTSATYLAASAGPNPPTAIRVTVCWSVSNAFGMEARLRDVALSASGF